MTFTDLAAGDTVFLDANMLVYHFAPDPVLGPACTQLVKRIENQSILGFTSTHVISEVTHRLMTIEAIQRFGWPVPGIAQRLRPHPLQVQQLSAFRQATEKILQSQIQV